MVKALIVENEGESAKLMASLLREDFSADVELLGVCHDLDSAIRQFQSASPDIVFLDIELDGESGFDLFQKVEARNFEVVFTTAYPDYAVRAIKNSCLEYLLKPVQKDDVALSLSKFQ